MSDTLHGLIRQACRAFYWASFWFIDLWIILDNGVKLSEKAQDRSVLVEQTDGQSIWKCELRIYGCFSIVSDYEIYRFFPSTFLLDCNIFSCIQFDNLKSILVPLFLFLLSPFIVLPSVYQLRKRDSVCVYVCVCVFEWIRARLIERYVYVFLYIGTIARKGRFCWTTSTESCSRWRQTTSTFR